MQAVNIPGFLWLAFVASTLPPGGGDFLSFFGLFLGALAFQCSVGIIGFVGLILFVIGAYSAHEGREEYGPDHARDVERALIFFIIAFVMGVIASVGGFGFSTGPVGTGVPINPVGGIFGAVRGLFAGLTLRYVVRTFLRKEERDLGWVGTALLTGAPAAGSVVSFVLFLAGNPLDSSFNPSALPGLLALAFVTAAALAAAELVAYVLFLHIYSRALRRLRSGEIPAIPRPPVLYAPYYPAPGYYPANPWVPSYPQTPPPEGPPPGQPPP
jgi:hypothetical protein